MDMASINPNNIRKYLRELRTSGTYETVFKDAITAGEFAHWYHLYKVIQEQKSTVPTEVHGGTDCTKEEEDRIRQTERNAN